ncbi:MAG TPA: hypothetical protein VGD73_12215 [Pseudonocardia sp.]|jgi:hypothetical protein|uniref:hypothetical protein n=1 Tax=Pseudonocardia sp. TaxID=60912 RepID=UPI002ED853C8
MGTREHTAPGARMRWWPWALIAGGVSLFVGGMLHPEQAPAASEAAGLAAWIGDPLWIPAHTFILLSSILLVLGLVGLLGHRPDLPESARRAGWLAVAGAALSAVENVPHLAATTESAAAAAGHATPLLHAHMTLALISFPLFGLSLGALALLSGGRLAYPLFGALAAVGGIAWAIAPWAVGPFAVESLAVLFIVGMLMALWFVAVGVRALLTRRSAVPPATATHAGA